MPSSRLLLLLFALLALSACPTARNYLEPDRPKFTGSFAPPPGDFDGVIRVVSFNIEYSKKIERAIAELKAHPDLRDADILLLQEMDENGSEQIARELKYNYVYYPATFHPRTKRNFGNAILSKWPILDTWKVLLPHEVIGVGTRRIAVYATLRIGTESLLAGSVHTATIWQAYDHRMAQADSALRGRTGNFEHVLIGGDFNTLELHSQRDVTEIFSSHGLRKASGQIGPTATLGPIARTLDHIYAKGLRTRSQGIVRDSKASDHWPIWLDLEFIDPS